MLALQLALRFLGEGRTQTSLILAGVTVGVAAYVFITATMLGVEQNMVAKTLGSQAHISVLDEPMPPQPLVHPEGRLVLRTVVQPEPRQKPFDQWQRALERVEATPGVRAACPTLAGSGLAIRGGGQQAIRVVGADPTRLRRIIDIPANLVEGSWRPDADQVVIGSVLAEELGLALGRPMRIRTSAGEASVRVVGIFELGSDAVDGQWVVTSLRTAQSLLGRPGDISSIDATVDELFAADEVAERVAARTGLTAESWMARNGALLTALSAQSQSTTLIRVFTLLAVAMGIASVLAVTVVQRRGQIGILRAMGVRARTILATFLWQGALLGIGGALLGTALGMLVGGMLERVVPFDIVVGPSTALQALAISLLTGLGAALWPARTAARMDPAAAIRGDE
ncbi:MAG: ABC transporter permease [Deltaproteobacteria bacterium]|nr:MAG: ABC transporter permease [Deltaproteobacteria bacterium]